MHNYNYDLDYGEVVHNILKKGFVLMMCANMRLKCLIWDLKGEWEITTLEWELRALIKVRGKTSVTWCKHPVVGGSIQGIGG